MNLYKAISNWISELPEVVNEYKPIRCYKNLIHKTKSVHTVAISKHCTAFTKFCTENEQAIIEQSVDKLTNKNITYSENAFIDLEKLFDLLKGDKYESYRFNTWKYLLIITSLVLPESTARDVLRGYDTRVALVDQEPVTLSEDDLVVRIFEKTKKQIELLEDASPMDTLTAIMGSGVIQELMSEMNHKDFNKEIFTKKLKLLFNKFVDEMDSSSDQYQYTKRICGVVNGVLDTIASGKQIDMLSLLPSIMSVMSMSK